jgi:hypothetical protein
MVKVISPTEFIADMVAKPGKVTIIYLNIINIPQTHAGLNWYGTGWALQRGCKGDESLAAPGTISKNLC